MDYLSAKYDKIAEMLGLKITKASPDDLRLRYRGSNASVVLNWEICGKVLNFLNEIRLARLADCRTYDGLPTLDALKMRAIAIGTEITEDEEHNYHYKRPRFYILGAKREFCFVVKNALEPKRLRNPLYGSPYYLFRNDEYPLLVKWVEHDEELYARLNRESEDTK